MSRLCSTLPIRDFQRLSHEGMSSELIRLYHGVDPIDGHSSFAVGNGDLALFSSRHSATVDQKLRGRTQCRSNCDVIGDRISHQWFDVLALRLATGVWLDQHRTTNNNLHVRHRGSGALVCGRTLWSRGGGVRVRKFAAVNMLIWLTAYSSAFVAPRVDEMALAGRRSSIGSLRPGRRTGKSSDKKPNVAVRALVYSVHGSTDSNGRCSFCGTPDTETSAIEIVEHVAGLCLTNCASRIATSI